MKSTIIGILVLGLALLLSCNKDKKETPKCIWNKISDFDESFDWEEAKVDKYTFQGKTVYVFDPGVCSQADMASEVLNQECESICYLGGQSGNQTINGENFSNAHFEETIWEK